MDNGPGRVRAAREGAIEGRWTNKLKRLYRRGAKYLANLDRGFRLATALGAAGGQEYVRVGLLEDKTKRSALSMFGRAAYRLY
jgi:hypothetical protein